MEKLTKEFINYLFDIGIVGVTSVKEFINIFNQVHIRQAEENSDKGSYYNEYLMKEALSSSLVKYLESLSDESKRLLSLNVVTKFAEFKALGKIKVAKTLFIIYSKKVKQSKLKKKKENFMKWRQICLEFRNNMSIFHSRSSILETSAYKKEMEELKNCTFKPEINKNVDYLLIKKNSSQYNRPAFERLYCDHERLTNKLALKKIEKDCKESLSFTPNVTLTSNKNSSFNLSKNNFFERQQHYKSSKSKTKEKIIKDFEEDISSKYTFSPKILKTTSTKNDTSVLILNSSQSKYKNYLQTVNNSENYPQSNLNLPTHERLYHDQFRRDRSIQMIKKQQNEDIINLSRSIEKVRKSYLDKSRSNSKSPKYKNKNSVDLKKIEKLYNDHKKNKSKIKDLQTKIENDNGITFKPELYQNEKYETNMKFFERNKKLLEDKKNFVEIYNQIYDDNMAQQRLGNKKCTPDEYEAICKGIFERLYAKGVEKIQIRKSQEDISDKDKLDFKNYLRNEDIKSSNVDSSNKPKETPVEKIPYTSPKHFTNLLMKNQNKNLTFGISNNSKDKEQEKSTTGHLNIQQNQFHLNNYNKDKVVAIDNYTFGKDSKKGKYIDKNYNYQFDEALNVENEEDEGDNPNMEDRVRITNTNSSKKSNHRKFTAKNKNIIVETADTNYVIPNNFLNRNQKLTEKNETAVDYNISDLENPNSYR